MMGNELQTVYRSGYVAFFRVMPSDYSRLKRDYLDDYGIELPNYSSEELVEERDLRMLNHECSVTLYFRKKGPYRYRFKKGWIHDTASVPPALRGLVDNDDRRLVLAAMVHDANFKAHWLSFTESNRLFYQMARKAGYPWFKATMAWIAVSSPIGYYLFKKNRNSKTVKNERKWVYFNKS